MATSNSKNAEGAAVPPQAKGSWSSFLKVRQVSFTCESVGEEVPIGLLRLMQSGFCHVSGCRAT